MPSDLVVEYSTGAEIDALPEFSVRQLLPNGIGCARDRQTSCVDVRELLGGLVLVTVKDVRLPVWIVRYMFFEALYVAVEVSTQLYLLNRIT